MQGLPPDAFAARLAGIRDHLAGLAKTAADGLIDGMEGIAEAAVKRLVERTPRSDDDTDHIADGWTARRAASVPGEIAIDIVNVSPKATEKLQLADGTVTDYTLLEILEYGSRPHEIEPVNAPLLVFRSRGGDIVRTKHVEHPGTQPYAMVGTTETEVTLEVKRLIDATRRTLTLKRI